MKMRTVICLLATATFAVAAEKIPLPEHPRPDWQRAEWQNLNGSWCFAPDKADAGVKDKWFAADDTKFPQRILVPFGWGSPASGVKDEADVGWYRRDVTVPAAWKGKRVFLVVGASDHDTSCWFGNTKLGEHSGGYTPFEFELTPLVKWGEAQKLTLGIWQTVYLEARGETYLDTVNFTPDIDTGRVTAEVTLGAPAKKPLAVQFVFKAADRAEPAVAAFAPGQSKALVEIPFEAIRLWDLDDPYLYEVRCVLLGEGVTDAVNTYFGMRKVGVGKLPGTDYPYVTLNNKPIYLQLTLDQSYHPDGWYTFPSDEFMKNEILISKKLALSGNRVHIKVEVPRKLYWADKLGLLIMADVPCAWGPASEAMFREHWFCFEDMVRRDYNHPSIFSWVLFNETWGLFSDGGNWGKDRHARYAPWTRRAVARAYEKAKELDPTRLVEDNSECNGDHVVTDLNTWHGYLPGWKWEERVATECKKSFPGSTHRYIGGFVQGGEPMHRRLRAGRRADAQQRVRQRVGLQGLDGRLRLVVGLPCDDERVPPPPPVRRLALHRTPRRDQRVERLCALRPHVEGDRHRGAVPRLHARRLARRRLPAARHRTLPYVQGWRDVERARGRVSHHGRIRRPSAQALRHAPLLERRGQA